MLIEIIKPQQTERADLVNFCRICKQLRRSVISQLYGSVELNYSDQIYKFLLSILRNRSLGLLVKTLDAMWDNITLTYGRSVKHREDKSEMESIYTAALEYSLGAPIVQCVRVGSESAAVILLLCSLPNLVKLQVRSPYGIERFTPAFRFEEHLGTRFLGKLEHYASRKCYDAECLLYFFNLPSIRVITIDVLETFGQTMASHGCTSTVERLHMRHCTVEKHRLMELMRLPRILKEFSFTDGRVVWEPYDVPTSIFGEALEHVRDTLEVYMYSTVPYICPQLIRFRASRFSRGLRLASTWWGTYRVRASVQLRFYHQI